MEIRPANPFADANDKSLQDESLEVAFERKSSLLKRLDDPQWAKVAQVLPPLVGARARNSPRSRTFVEAVLWVAHTGAHWNQLPREFGMWHSNYVRFTRWAHDGIWKLVIDAMQDSPDVAAPLAGLVERYLASRHAHLVRNYILQKK